MAAPLDSSTVKLWLADGQILCYRISEMSRSTVDVVAEDLRVELMGWDRTRFWRLMLDVCSGTIVSTYALNRVREMTRLRPDVCGKLAVVTANVLTAQIASLALRGLPNEWRQRLVFSSEADAVAWLLQNDKIEPLA